MGWEFFGCNVKNIKDVNNTRYKKYCNRDARRIAGVALTEYEADDHIASKEEKHVPFFMAHYPSSALALATNALTKKLMKRIDLVNKESNALNWEALGFVIKTKTKTCKVCGARILTGYYQNIHARFNTPLIKGIDQWCVSCTNCNNRDGIASTAHVKKRETLREKRLVLEAHLRAEQERLLEKLLKKNKIKLEYAFGIWLHESEAAEINGDDYY